MFFFGPDLEQGKSAIIIPRYDFSRMPSLVQIEEPPLPLESADCTDLPDQSLLSLSDTRSAINIEILFEKNHFNRPELIFADQNENFDISNYKTLFVIGLHCKPLTIINKFKQNNQLFIIDTSSSGFKITERNNGLSGTPINSTNLYVDTQIIQYGSIAKLKSNGTVIFFVGGNDAGMTEKCSTYLLGNWKKIYEYEDESLNPSMKFEDREFAICIKHEIANKESMDIIHKFAQADHSMKTFNLA